MPLETYNLLLAVAGGIFFVAALLALGRMLAGPNSMDRLVSLDSSIAMSKGMLAVYIAWSMDTSVVYAMVVIALLGFILVCGTLMVAWFTRGLLALDTMDFWFGNLSLYLTTGLYLYLFCAVWGSNKGLAELRRGSVLQLPRPIVFIITIVTPAILITIF